MITESINNSTAKSRLINLLDHNSFTEFNNINLNNPIGSEVITGFGHINGKLVYVFSQDISQNNGAIGPHHAKKITKLYELAAKTGNPIISIFDSNGIYINQQIESLYSYSDILMWCNRLSGVVPQISLILGTCSGCSSIIAASSDIVIAAKSAEFFLTPPFISNNHDKKIQGAGTAINAAVSGTANIIMDSEIDCINQARKIISILPQNNISPLPIISNFKDNNSQPSYESLSQLDIVFNIADKDSTIVIDKEYSQKINTILATLNGIPVAVIATQNKDDYIDSNACLKAARFIRFADCFNIPIITLLNTQGFAQSSEQELLGSIKSASVLSHAYAEATSPKITVITGNAFGSSFIVMGSKNSNSDMILAWPNATISALQPEASVELLYKDQIAQSNDPISLRKELVNKYINTDTNPSNLSNLGFIDNIISPENTKDYLHKILNVLCGKRVSNLPKKHSNMHI